MPLSRLEVTPANLCSCRFNWLSRVRADFRKSDLSSRSVSIMPKATKTLGVFQISSFKCRAGQKPAIDLKVNEAPHSRNPAALAMTPGDHRGYRRQYRNPGRLKPRVSRISHPKA